MTFLLTWGAGVTFPGAPGPTMVDTLEAQYACGWSCTVEALRSERAFSRVTSHELDEAGHLFDPDAGLLVEYGRTFDRPPYHVWCPTCGRLVEHGDGQDAEHVTCNDDGCDAPEHVEPD